MYLKQTVSLRENITDDRFHFNLVELIKMSTNKKAIYEYISFCKQRKVLIALISICSVFAVTQKTQSGLISKCLQQEIIIHSLKVRLMTYLLLFQSRPQFKNSTQHYTINTLQYCIIHYVWNNCRSLYSEYFVSFSHKKMESFTEILRKVPNLFQ